MDEPRSAVGGGRSGWLLPLAFLAFVSLGLPDGVLGVAWPFMRRTFERPLDHLGFLMVMSVAGYLTSSFCAGIAVARLGVGRLLLVSSLLVMANAVLWALTPFWWLVPLGSFVSGLGAGAIDAGVNAFAAARWTPRVVTWLHASWGLGATLGPVIMTATIAHGLTWRGGYGALATALGLMALLFALTLRLWDTERSAARPTDGTSVWARMAEALRSAAVRRNALLFFIYTGIEGSAGGWAFSLLTEARGLERGAAGAATSAYWGSLFAGRVLFGFIAHHVSPRRLLRVSMVGVPVAALAFSLARGAGPSLVSLMSLGLLLAPVFPLLIAETPARVGERHADHAIGFQISAATLGAGSLAATVGVVAQRVGLEALGPCLLVLALLLLTLHETAPRAPART